jgi:hypothetical protein
VQRSVVDTSYRFGSCNWLPDFSLSSTLGTLVSSLVVGKNPTTKTCIHQS